MQTSSNLLPELLADFDSPDLRWQLLALVLCVVGGWLLSHALMRRFSEQPVTLGSFSTALDSFQRVLTPLVTLLLIVIAILVLSRWQTVALLRTALPLLLSFLLIRLVFYMLRKAFARNGHVGGVLQAFEQVFAVLVWSGLAIYITGLWPEFVLFLEDTTLPVGRHRESLLVILQALDAVHSSIRVVLARAGRALFLLVAVLISLSLVGIDLTVLSVFGGALGVGLGLGLQKLVSSYVSGVVILLERSLALGDIVSVDKYRGEVVQINARCTVLRAGDGSEAVIPNEMMVSSPLQNFSLSDRQVRLSSQLTVGYQTDIDEFTTTVRRAVQELPRVMAEPAPDVLIRRLAPEGIELEVAFWIADPEKGSAGLVSEVNHRLLALIRSQNVHIPQPGEKESPVLPETDKSLINKPSSSHLSD